MTRLYGSWCCDDTSIYNDIVKFDISFLKKDTLSKKAFDKLCPDFVKEKFIEILGGDFNYHLL